MKYRQKRDGRCPDVPVYQRHLHASHHFLSISRHQAGVRVHVEEELVDQGLRNRKACEVEPTVCFIRLVYDIPVPVGWGRVGGIQLGIVWFVPKGHITRIRPIPLSLTYSTLPRPHSCLQFPWPASSTEVFSSISSFYCPFPCDPYFPSSKDFTVPLADMPSQRCQCLR
jgi:hypothetical protein